MLVALAGGVGAARFLRGLVRAAEPSNILIVVNTGDDDVFHGLHVSPDLDSVTYALAGKSNPETGWGLANETFRVMEGLDRFGAPTWFRLGDTDLATHLYRTQRLHAEATLSEATTEITRAFGIEARVVPMSDDRVSTMIHTSGNSTPMPMQEWFVLHKTRPSVTAVTFDGASLACPAPGVMDALETADSILLCPSNPVISIGPILALPGVRETLVARRDRVIGVSPIIAGAPVKGPADKLMGPLGIEVSCVGVARTYADFCSTLVIDVADAALAGAVEAEGVRCVVAHTLMTDEGASEALARVVLKEACPP